MREIEPSGLYIIRDSFFEQYGNDRYMQNKGENRPHYYAVRDKSGVLWMIPLSSQAEKYRGLIRKSEEKYGRGRCVMYVVLPIYGKDRAFLICDMFPVLPSHILRPYTIDGKPYILENTKLQALIKSKARAYLNMVERGVLKSPLDILSAREKLCADKAKDEK